MTTQQPQIQNPIQNRYPLIPLISEITPIKSQSLANVLNGLVQVLPKDTTWLKVVLQHAIVIANDVLQKNKPDPYFDRKNQNTGSKKEDSSAPEFLYETNNNGEEIPIAFILGEMSYVATTPENTFTEHFYGEDPTKNNQYSKIVRELTYNADSNTIAINANPLTSKHYTEYGKFTTNPTMFTDHETKLKNALKEFITKQNKN